MLMCEHAARIVYVYAYVCMRVCICMCASAPAFMCAHVPMLCVHRCLRIAVCLCTVLSKANLALQLPTFFSGS